MKFRILIVEHDENLGGSICDTISRAGFHPTSVTTGEEAFFIATTEVVDAVVLALDLPGRDGLEFLSALRKQYQDLPIITTSWSTKVRERIKILRAGADDVLTKPFSLGELEARLQALLRRSRTIQQQQLVVADLVLNLVLRRATRGGHPLQLTTLEFRIVELMMRHEGSVVSRTTLAQFIWNDANRATPLDNVIDVHFGRIRKKIDPPHLPKLFSTVRGIGFILSGDS